MQPSFTTLRSHAARLRARSARLRARLATLRTSFVTLRNRSATLRPSSATAFWHAARLPVPQPGAGRDGAGLPDPMVTDRRLGRRSDALERSAV